MLAYYPEYRTKQDTEDFGDAKFLTDEEIADVVEYVLQISGQQADRGQGRPRRCAVPRQHQRQLLRLPRHGRHRHRYVRVDNLTRRNLYLYGSDRASILESIIKGRRGTMPAFDDKLKPEEIKAVSVFVFSHAAK